jgi:hypothetical protein
VDRPGSASGPVLSGSPTISGTGAGLKGKYADIDFGASLPAAGSTTRQAEQRAVRESREEFAHGVSDSVTGAENSEGPLGAFEQAGAP